MNNIKVLILTNKMLPYRIPLYNLLGKQYSLTVASVNSFDDKYSSFTHMELPSKRASRFVFNENLDTICSNYDVVIIMFDLSWISYISLIFKKNRCYKVILWGIGLSSKDGLKNKNKSIIDKIRYRIAKKADALILYSEYPVQFYISNGIPKDNIFIAHNTIYNNYKFKRETERNTFLFIGGLNKRKGLFILLESFKKVICNIPLITKLYIIGSGEEEELIQKWIKDNELEYRVILAGDKRGTDLDIYFEQAIATISPNQAGLSVLHSLSYGVPFITSSNSITGGELYNIKHGETGYLYKSTEELESYLIELANNKKPSIFYENVYKYYVKNRSMQNMGDAFIQSIKYALNK